MSTTASLQPHDLRGTADGALGLAEQLAAARESLRRIDDILATMHDLYTAQGDTRAVILVDTIRAKVIARELPKREPVPVGVTGLAIGTRHREGSS